MLSLLTLRFLVKCVCPFRQAFLFHERQDAPWPLSRMFLANTFVLFPVIYEAHFLQVHTCHCHLMYSVPFLHLDSTYKIQCPLVKLEQFLSKTGVLGQLFYKGVVLGKGGILYKSIDCQKRDNLIFLNNLLDLESPHLIPLRSFWLELVLPFHVLWFN